jgi:hypothetical protein
MCDYSRFVARQTRLVKISRGFPEQHCRAYNLFLLLHASSETCNLLDVE